MKHKSKNRGKRNRGVSIPRKGLVLLKLPKNLFTNYAACVSIPRKGLVLLKLSNLRIRENGGQFVSIPRKGLVLLKHLDLNQQWYQKSFQSLGRD